VNVLNYPTENVSCLAKLNREDVWLVVHGVFKGGCGSRLCNIAGNTQSLEPRLTFLIGSNREAEAGLPFNLEPGSENVNYISFRDTVISKIFYVTVNIVQLSANKGIEIPV